MSAKDRGELEDRKENDLRLGILQSYQRAKSTQAWGSTNVSTNNRTEAQLKHS